MHRVANIPNIISGIFNLKFMNARVDLRKRFDSQKTLNFKKNLAFSWIFTKEQLLYPRQNPGTWRVGRANGGCVTQGGLLKIIGKVRKLDFLNNLMLDAWP